MVGCNGSQKRSDATIWAENQQTVANREGQRRLTEDG